MLRDVLQVIFRRTTGRTDRGRTTTTTDGRTWADGQRTDDDDGTDVVVVYVVYVVYVVKPGAKMAGAKTYFRYIY